MVSIDVDSSVFFQIANFLILLVALNYLLYRPIRGILRARAEKIAQLNGDINSSIEGVNARNREMEAELARARREGVDAKEELKDQGHSKEQEIVELAASEMERRVAEVREQIAADMGKAREELKGQVQVFGQDLAQKILGRSIQ